MTTRARVFVGSSATIETKLNEWLDENVNCNPPKAALLRQSVSMGVAPSAVVLLFFYDELQACIN